MTDTPAAAGTLVERLRNRNVPPSNNLNVEAAEELAEQQRVIDAQYEQLSACRAELAVKSKQHVEAHANCSELFKTVCEISQLTPLHGEVDEYAAVVEAVRAIVAAKEESERLLAAAEEALHRIVQWSEAYPVEVFPEMIDADWKRADVVLKDGGLSLTRISAANMRHVVTEVGKIAIAAIAGKDSPK